MEADAPSLTPREHQDLDRADASGRPVVVFVHGLWMLSSSWSAWRELFEAQGYATLAPMWPADPASVAAARANAKGMAVNSIATVTEHVAGVIGLLRAKPVIVGHSFGGLVAQKLAGRGLASATVAISPAPVRGIVTPPPPSMLRASWPIVHNPINRHRAVLLTFKQFRYAFANAVGESEARQLYDCYAVPGAGRLLFEVAAANLNPRSAARVNPINPERGPMKIISGERDRIVPWSIAKAAFTQQLRNPAPTEFIEVLGRGHSLCIDSGWEDIADVVLRFVHRAMAA